MKLRLWMSAIAMAMPALAPCHVASAAPSPAAAFDFNGDGMSDLAVGAPGEAVHRQPGAGQVHVIFGSSSGMSRSDVVLNGSSPTGDVQELDGLGSTIASGDFNGDGFADLAAGAPDAAYVQVFFGDQAGFDLSRGEHLGLPSGAGPVPSRFGWAMAVGDFNGDGFADLAVGAPGAQPTGVGLGGDGRVAVFYGAAAGVKDGQIDQFDENTPGISNMSQGATDDFGDALTTGDFNGDSYPDLSIGVPGLTVSGVPQAGGVRVLYGSSAGLSTDGSQLWTLNSPGVKGQASSTTQEDDVTYGDRYGSALASGDFDGDSFADLAVGAPDKGEGTTRRGAVGVLYGASSGLSNRSQYFDQATPGIPGALGSHYFGGALAAGDFESDGHADLAIAAPDTPVNGEKAAGAVVVVAGGTPGLRLPSAKLYTEQTEGIPGPVQRHARFGVSLRALASNGSRFDNLIVGIPGQTVGSAQGAGAVDVLPGNQGGRLAVAAVRVTENSPGIRDASEQLDGFGRVGDCLRRIDRYGHTK